MVNLTEKDKVMSLFRSHTLSEIMELKDIDRETLTLWKIEYDNNLKESIGIKKITLYESISNKYKKIVNQIKKNYYVKMNLIETQREYVKKYNNLDSILLSDSKSVNAIDKLLLIMLLEGYMNELDNKDLERCNLLINEKEKTLRKTK